VSDCPFEIGHGFGMLLDRLNEPVQALESVDLFCIA
jgi:hypothetical protein